MDQHAQCISITFSSTSTLSVGFHWNTDKNVRCQTKSASAVILIYLILIHSSCNQNRAFSRSLAKVLPDIEWSILTTVKEKIIRPFPIRSWLIRTKLERSTQCLTEPWSTPADGYNINFHLFHIWFYPLPKVCNPLHVAHVQFPLIY